MGRTSRYALLSVVPMMLQFSYEAPARCDDPGRIEHVIVEGMGTTQDDALLASYRNAVNQVVGTMVDSKTIIANDQLVRDSVIAFSNGYIDHYKLLSIRFDSGLCYVRIEASVQVQKLTQKLQDLHLLSIAVDGRSLQAQAVTKSVRHENGAKALWSAMVPLLRAEYVQATDAAVLEAAPSGAGKAAVSFRVTLGVDQDAFARLTKRVQELASGLGRELSDADLDRVFVYYDRLRFRTSEALDGADTYVDVIRHQVSTAGPLSEPRARKLYQTAAEAQLVIQSGDTLVGYSLPRSAMPVEQLERYFDGFGLRLKVRLLSDRGDVLATSGWTCLPWKVSTEETCEGGTPRFDRGERGIDILGRFYIGRDGPIVAFTNLAYSVDIERDNDRLTAVSGPVQMRGVIQIEQAALAEVARIDVQLEPYPNLHDTDH